MATHKPKMVFLTSPNNPDGSMMTDDEVRSRTPGDSRTGDMGCVHIVRRGQRGMAVRRERRGVLWWHGGR